VIDQELSLYYHFEWIGGDDASYNTREEVTGKTSNFFFCPVALCSVKCKQSKIAIEVKSFFPSI